MTEKRRNNPMSFKGCNIVIFGIVILLSSIYFDVINMEILRDWVCLIGVLFLVVGLSLVVKEVLK